MEVPILYEDADVVAIDKPAGLIVHSDGRTEEPSVAEWVLARYPALAEVGEPWTSPQGAIVARPGIVHRLDRDTSGVLAIAKTNEAYALLKQQFQDREIEKVYRAYVYGHPKDDAGTIEAEIVRIRAVPPRWGVARAGESKKQRAAVTDWRVLARGADEERGEKAASLELRPKTGRTHQIRVHLKSINHPVVCDPLYAKGRPAILGFSRLALHALSLTLTLPSGGRQTVTAPVPGDFVVAEARLRFS
ncbi:MAG: RluA family pseudouridine synthase [Patescibacteria group bacterium]|nr:RluA family pseudouridine synthase [Patescibacteria group bacterium]MDE1944132.1 RluA family pseudouridine synthase [Patescibacteria group bacterium]MDE1944753.1 RluA family pseudouridine synthase [Patescibacteria group bacterium]MDE2057961.1 RluA family pseudouridine synthase [Patescibacteria group bacterium]